MTILQKLYESGVEEVANEYDDHALRAFQPRTPQEHTFKARKMTHEAERLGGPERHTKAAQAHEAARNAYPKSRFMHSPYQRHKESALYHRRLARITSESVLSESDASTAARTNPEKSAYHLGMAKKHLAFQKYLSKNRSFPKPKNRPNAERTQEPRTGWDVGRWDESVQEGVENEGAQVEEGYSPRLTSLAHEATRTAKNLGTSRAHMTAAYAHGKAGTAHEAEHKRLGNVDEIGHVKVSHKQMAYHKKMSNWHEQKAAYHEYKAGEVKEGVKNEARVEEGNPEGFYSAVYSLRSSAHKAAQKAGLKKSDVRSRPSGYVIDRIPHTHLKDLHKNDLSHIWHNQTGKRPVLESVEEGDVSGEARDKDGKWTGFEHSILAHKLSDKAQKVNTLTAHLKAQAQHELARGVHQKEEREHLKKQRYDDAAGSREAVKNHTDAIQFHNDARRRLTKEGVKESILDEAFAFHRPSKDSKSEEGYHYHATNEENAHEIASHGIKVHRPSYGTDQHSWPDGHTEKRAYFTPNAHVAHSFAPEHGKPVLLRVHHTKGEFKKESTGDTYSQKKIHPKHIEVAHEDGSWHPISKLHASESLEEYITGTDESGFTVHSHTGKRLGKYRSRKAAQKRLAQIEMFKHMESVEESYVRGHEEFLEHPSETANHLSKQAIDRESHGKAAAAHKTAATFFKGKLKTGDAASLAAYHYHSRMAFAHGHQAKHNPAQGISTRIGGLKRGEFGSAHESLEEADSFADLYHRAGSKIRKHLSDVVAKAQSDETPKDLGGVKEFGKGGKAYGGEKEGLLTRLKSHFQAAVKQHRASRDIAAKAVKAEAGAHDSRPKIGGNPEGPKKHSSFAHEQSKKALMASKTAFLVHKSGTENPTQLSKVHRSAMALHRTAKAEMENIGETDMAKHHEKLFQVHRKALHKTKVGESVEEAVQHSAIHTKYITHPRTGAGRILAKSKTASGKIVQSSIPYPHEISGREEKHKAAVENHFKTMGQKRKVTSATDKGNDRGFKFYHSALESTLQDSGNEIDGVEENRDYTNMISGKLAKYNKNYRVGTHPHTDIALKASSNAYKSGTNETHHYAAQQHIKAAKKYLHGSSERKFHLNKAAFHREASRGLPMETMKEGVEEGMEQSRYHAVKSESTYGESTSILSRLYEDLSHTNTAIGHSTMAHDATARAMKSNAPSDHKTAVRLHFRAGESHQAAAKASAPGSIAHAYHTDHAKVHTDAVAQHRSALKTPGAPMAKESDEFITQLYEGIRTKRKALLKPHEDAEWTKHFSMHLDAGRSPSYADKRAWAHVQRTFPRLRGFAGAHPGVARESEHEIQPVLKESNDSHDEKGLFAPKNGSGRKAVHASKFAYETTYHAKSGEDNLHGKHKAAAWAHNKAAMAHQRASHYSNEAGARFHQDEAQKHLRLSSEHDIESRKHSPQKSDLTIGNPPGSVERPVRSHESLEESIGYIIHSDHTGHHELHPVTYTHIKGEKAEGVHLYHVSHNGLMTHKGIFPNERAAKQSLKAALESTDLLSRLYEGDAEGTSDKSYAKNNSNNSTEYDDDFDDEDWMLDDDEEFEDEDEEDAELGKPHQYGFGKEKSRKEATGESVEGGAPAAEGVEEGEDDLHSRALKAYEASHKAKTKQEHQAAYDLHKASMLEYGAEAAKHKAGPLGRINSVRANGHAAEMQSHRKIMRGMQ